MSPRRLRKSTSAVTPKPSPKNLETRGAKSVVATRSSVKKICIPPSSVNASPTKGVNTRHSASLKKSPVKKGANQPVTPQKTLLENIISKSPLQKSPIKTICTRSSPRSAQSNILLKSSPQSTPNNSPQRRVRGQGDSQLSPQRVTRKRLLSTPEKSPQPPKQRLRRTPESPVKVKEEPKSEEDDCIIIESSTPVPAVKTTPSLPVECPVKCEDGKESQVSTLNSKTETSLPADPELSGKFLRRKWFSLKTRGGFTCLRSAILSPEEIAQEVIQHTMVYTPKAHEANFFTMKLMVRLSSRLPPTRARPSCEELVELINSKQRRKKLDTQKQPKGEGTAIRVKVERRSFTDTISHVTSNPPQPDESTAAAQKDPQSRMGRGPVQAQDELTKQKEREIALMQLQNMRYWRGGEYRY